jgi:hypothetical protein
LPTGDNQHAGLLLGRHEFLMLVHVLVKGLRERRFNWLESQGERLHVSRIDELNNHPDWSCGTITIEVELVTNPKGY